MTGHKVARSKVNGHELNDWQLVNPQMTIDDALEPNGLNGDHMARP